jgi:small ligand-binding sensory domain FIST
MLQPGSAEWHRMLLSPGAFCRTVDVPADAQLVILLADPFSIPMDDVLHAFATCYPGIPMVGGMASGALRPNGNVLIANDFLTRQGAVGLALSGNLSVDLIVSQGCRPIWRPFKVQSAHRNLIYNLEGRPPLAWLQDLIPELSDEDRALLQNGLFVGRAIDPDRDEMGRGDFLIRGLMGIDQENGAIAIGDSVMEGETIQFHLRDVITAQEDLEMMLIPQMFRQPPSGGLLFTCNGRGTRLYDHPNGDISIIQNSIQNLRLAGFFCAGEIGPVGNQNFVHGQTVSLALFRPLHDTG